MGQDKMVNKPLTGLTRNRTMTLKRLFDLTFVLIFAIPAACVFAACAALLWRENRGPVVVQIRRFGFSAGAFHMLKFRTIAAGDSGGQGFQLHSAGAVDRQTSLGRWMRFSRLDEIPQLFQVALGQMTLVGPRPVAPEVIAAAPEAYGPLSASGARPGLTGLATVIVCGREERILGRCDAHESEATYLRRCVGIKTRIERIYLSRQGVGLDLYVLYLTLARYLPLPGRRAGRLWRDAAMTRRARQAARIPQVPLMDSPLNARVRSNLGDSQARPVVAAAHMSAVSSGLCR